MTTAKPLNQQITWIARLGLSAKGIVYCVLGVLAFMAAFHIGGGSPADTDKDGVFDFIHRQSGGKMLLLVVAIGLFCYTIWRCIEAFGDTEHKGKSAKGLAARARYLLSGLVYASVAVSALQMALTGNNTGGDSQQELAAELLNRPAGQWLAGIAAIILLGIGIYQIYYGLSEKYRKHVDRVASRRTKPLLKAGKIGYVARGIVWLLIAWLFLQAALHANAEEAGGTSKAFSFLQQSAYGPILLAAVAIGLICYGIFSFVRARYEKFS